MRATKIGPLFRHRTTPKWDLQHFVHRSRSVARGLRAGSGAPVPHLWGTAAPPSSPKRIVNCQLPTGQLVNWPTHCQLANWSTGQLVNWSMYRQLASSPVNWPSQVHRQLANVLSTGEPIVNWPTRQRTVDWPTGQSIVNWPTHRQLANSLSTAKCIVNWRTHCPLANWSAGHRTVNWPTGQRTVNSSTGQPIVHWQSPSPTGQLVNPSSTGAPAVNSPPRPSLPPVNWPADGQLASPIANWRTRCQLVDPPRTGEFLHPRPARRQRASCTVNWRVATNR